VRRGVQHRGYVGSPFCAEGPALAAPRRAVALAEREGDRRFTAVNNARLGTLHLLAGAPPMPRLRSSRPSGC